jgi:RHS repeat-associated protein
MKRKPLAELSALPSRRHSSTVAYTYYDLAGNRLSMSLDGVVFVTYGYDDASRLSTITRGSSVFGFGYDNANRRTNLNDPNGVNTTYVYDNLSRLTSLTAARSGNTITQWGYTYDNAGNRTQKTAPDYTEDYGYDALSRLTDVNRTGAAGAKRWIYGYDPVGNRIREQIDNNVSTPAYNEKNQLLSSMVGGLLRFKGTLNEPGTVTVNGQAAHMLSGNTFEATVSANAGTNTIPVVATDGSGNSRTNNYQVIVAGTAASYGYDSNGNLTSKTEGGATWTYEWNAENQLTRVLNNGSEAARFKYDPLGRRVEKVVDGNTTTWTYDGSAMLRQVSGSSTLKYVHGPGIDEPLAQEDGGGALGYFHVDGLGSIVKTTNSAGTVTATRRYEAFGNFELGATNGYSFTGREWDSETGLYYYRARYYDPKTGRFISEDPIRFAGGVNFYRYVRNSPTGWRDPWGLQSPQDVEEISDIMYLMMLTPDADYHEYGFMICRRPNGQLVYGPGALGPPGASIVRNPPCPPGAKPAARCHTHPNKLAPYAGFFGLEEGLVGDDLASAIADAASGIADYIGADGKIYKFVPPGSQQACPCSGR